MRFDPTPLYWIAGGCAAAFLLFIGVTLMVALFAADDRAERAREILSELLAFLAGLLAAVRPAAGSRGDVRSPR